jgi:hypothetical protein
MDERDYGMGCVSVKRLTAVGLEVGAPLLGTLGYEKKALGMGISLHGGSGNLEWAHLPGTLRDG